LIGGGGGGDDLFSKDATKFGHYLSITTTIGVGLTS
jgi:hypothetical protein